MCFAVQLNNFIKPWAATLKAAQTIAAVEHLDFNLFRVLIEMSLAETRSCTSGLGSRGPYQFVPPDSIAQAMHFCPGQNRTQPGHVRLCPGRLLFVGILICMGFVFRCGEPQKGTPGLFNPYSDQPQLLGSLDRANKFLLARCLGFDRVSVHDASCIEQRPHCFPVHHSNGVITHRKFVVCLVQRVAQRAPE